MLTVGPITLITETKAYCKVYWGKAKQGEGACSFSVHIDTRRGEGWKTRKEKALAEARHVAETFLNVVQADAA